MVILETNAKHTIHINYLFIFHKVNIYINWFIESSLGIKKLNFHGGSSRSGSYRKEIQMNPL